MISRQQTLSQFDHHPKITHMRVQEFVYARLRIVYKVTLTVSRSDSDMISKTVVKLSRLYFACFSLSPPSQTNIQACTKNSIGVYTYVCVRVLYYTIAAGKTGSNVDKMAKQLILRSSLLDEHVLYRCIVHLDFCDTFWLHVSLKIGENCTNHDN